MQCISKFRGKQKTKLLHLMFGTAGKLQKQHVFFTFVHLFSHQNSHKPGHVSQPSRLDEHLADMMGDGVGA